MTIETIGMIGGILLGICGSFQAWKSYQDKHSDGISWGFIITWTLGEVLMLAYVLAQYGLDVPLLFNLAANTVFCCIILYYKIKKLDKSQNL